MDYPLSCPPGNFCEGTGRSDYEPCPTGTFSNLERLETAAECQQCVSGAYCTNTGLTDVEGQCNSGYFCKIGSTQASPNTLATNHGPCPAYLFCAQDVSGIGVGQGTPCLPGTYNFAGGLAADTECTATVQGSYSNTVDMTDPIAPTMTKELCAEGYYCPASANAQTPANQQGSKKDQFCDRGQYCPEGSYETTTCAAGTFQFNKIQRECYQCPAGYYCPITAV